MGKFPRKVKGWKIVEQESIDEDEIYESEMEAEQFVSDAYSIEEVEMWECVDCGEKYEDKDEAYHCCE